LRARRQHMPRNNARRQDIGRGILYTAQPNAVEPYVTWEAISNQGEENNKGGRTHEKANDCCIRAICAVSLHRGRSTLM
jgi:hypothetical protein